MGWNYFKMLLEVVERYIVVGVLCYTSPLAFAMGGSKTTNQIFKSWCRMVGSQQCINVMEIRQTQTPEMELIDKINYNDTDSMLARKIQQLMIFFGLLIPDMTNEEEQMLDEALISSNNNKVPVMVKASRKEQQMITTDRAELAALLKEKQGEKLA